MPIPEANAPSTSILHRPFGGIIGYRQVADCASRVSIHAFEMATLQQLSSAGLLASPGAYIMTDFRTAYIGESIRPARRLAEHALDANKRGFAREVFVIAACDGCEFDGPLTMDLQFRLTNLAVEVGRVTVMRGANPSQPRLTPAARASHDRIFADATRLLNDAGCHILKPAEDLAAGSRATCEVADMADTDAGQMEIGVTTAPVGAEEFELTYDDVWARGYWADGHFVVAAGSEVRAQTNSSCDPVTRKRREDLFRAGVLSTIPAVENRLRLVVAVAFPSASIAAKVTCGTHTAARWLPLSRARVVLLSGLRQVS